ncbi:MAG: triose-phosphate isomerase [Pseudomonadota bacterium]
MARTLIAGNWKMNGLKSAMREARAVIDGLSPSADAECLICPPFTLVSAMAELAAESGLRVGGQDCHAQASGAHTGDVSAQMLADAGASYVIVGHSERREDHRETDTDVAAKADAAITAGLSPIICVGESLAEREAGRTLAVIADQLAGCLPNGAACAAFVVAYEPIWAIGTGLTPTRDQIAETHQAIRERLTARFGEATADATPIVYGGSMKPANAKEILSVPNVDGGLIGGASLKAPDFLAIYAAAG